MYQEILYDVTEPVATITLNRPDKLNALTGRMLSELRHALAAAENDARVVGIILTGAGRGFSAGADMRGLSAQAAAGEAGSGRGFEADPALDANPGDPSMGPDFQVTFGYLLSIRKPLIAAVNGPVAGLGLAIASLCDLRFASDQARFTIAFGQRGLIAEHGASWILPRLIGPGRALDLLWSSRRFDGVEAERLGLAERLCDTGDSLKAAKEYIRELAASAAPVSLKVMKQQVYRHLNMPIGDSLKETNRLMEESLRRGEFKEGVRSFIEKRPPRFPRVKGGVG
jgi:enoyl-CoA hydratase/carnithine racemase